MAISSFLVGNSHPDIRPVHIPRHAYTGPLLSIPPHPAPTRIGRHVKETAWLNSEPAPDPTMVLPGIVCGRVHRSQVRAWQPPTRRRDRGWLWHLLGGVLEQLLVVVFLVGIVLIVASSL